MSEIADLSAVDLARAIAERKLSAVETIEAVFRRIGEQNGLNAFITLCQERALAEARAADQALGRGDAVGPLHGIPFSVKDLINTAGVATTQGSALFVDNIPAEDAVAVERARTAGAVLIGKTTTPEFGHKPFTEAPLFGRTSNPWNREFTCGGSSGGAGVAVASGMGPLALGSDGGGSIRIPAACCGVVGLKATLGSIPNLQPPDLFGANSYVGPMARSVEEVRLLYEVLAGPDRRDPYGYYQTSAGGRHDQPLKIAWLPECGNAVDPDVERSVTSAIRHAEAMGIVVEQVELDFVALEEPFLVMLRSLLRTRLSRMSTETPELLDPTLLATIEAGAQYRASDLCEAQFARTACFSKIQALFGDYDLIASPTLSAPALPVGIDPLGHVEIAGRDAGTIRGAWYPYTYPFNLTGHPAISLPCGLSESGLPIGLQLVARWHEEHLLMATAARFEEAVGFEALAMPVLRSALSARQPTPTTVAFDD